MIPSSSCPLWQPDPGSAGDPCQALRTRCYTTRRDTISTGPGREPMAFDMPGIYHLPTWRMDLLPAGHFDLIIAVQVMPELGEALALHLFDSFATWLNPEGALYIRNHDLACLRGNRLDSEALPPARGFHRELRPLLADKVDLHGIPRLWRKRDPAVCYQPVDGDPTFGPDRR